MQYKEVWWVDSHYKVIIMGTLLEMVIREGFYLFVSFLKLIGNKDLGLINKVPEGHRYTGPWG